MVPLASATGIGVLSGTICVSLLFLWWALRAESRESDEEEAAERAEAEAAREAMEKAPRT